MMRTRTLGLGFGCLVTAVALAGCGAGSDPAMTEPATVGGQVVWSLTAQGLPLGPLAVDSTVTDSSGNGHDATVLPPRSGWAPDIEVVAADVPGGKALAFPAPCAEAGQCWRDILEVPDAPELSPGTADFVVSATLRLEPSQTSSGSNVVQKGFSTGGQGQWKLQVDGQEGRPSCTVVAPGDGVVHVVKSARSVSDGDWHVVQCRRTSESLAVVVDGAQTATDLPSGIDLRNSVPVRIGGKNRKLGNDPFHGQLAAVSLSVG